MLCLLLDAQLCATISLCESSLECCDCGYLSGSFFIINCTPTSCGGQKEQLLSSSCTTSTLLHFASTGIAPPVSPRTPYPPFRKRARAKRSGKLFEESTGLPSSPPFPIPSFEEPSECRWGNLKEEVYDAVRVVKKIGRDGRHARTRQLKLIGGMLRAVDPELMEAVIKAIKDGDVEGMFKKSGELTNEDNDNEENDDADDEDEENDHNAEEDDDGDFDIEEDQQQSPSSDEDDNMGEEDTIERWLQGLLCGDSDVVAEVYSIRSASFNRQELRRLVRDALKSQSKGLENDKEDSPQAIPEKPASLTRDFDPQAKLREYLENLAVKVQDDDH